VANNINGLSLVLPNLSHKAEYCRVMDRWKALESNIQPELMRRYSKRLGANVSLFQYDDINGILVLDFQYEFSKKSQVLLYESRN